MIVHVISVCLCSPAVSLDKQSVKQQVKKLEKRFSDLVDFVYRALLRKNTEDNVRYFRSSFLSLDVSRKHEHHNFIHEQLMKMDKEATFDEIWEKLTDYWNFLNFDLLDYIVDKFDIDHLKQKMDSYEHDLQSFRKATRLCDFIYCWPVQGETPPETELREFVAKMKHDWDNCTLEDLESLKGVITRKFFLPEFALLLKQIKEGCVVITWLIPTPFVKALQEAIKTTNSEFFIEHKIETITIDGQDCYPSLEQNLSYLQEPSFTHSQVSITPPMPTETFHPIKPVTSEEETMTLLDLEACLSSSGVSSAYTSRSPRYASRTSSSLWYNPIERERFDRPTPAEKHVREECVDEISQQVKLLLALKQYLSKAEVEADPSLPTRYKDYLSSTPAIRAALYTTFNAKMSAEAFSWSQRTKSASPTTMTELLTAFTLKTLVDHLSVHPVHHKLQLKMITFSDLSTDVYQQFQGVCRMAYEGILNRQQLIFSTAHHPPGFAPFGLMQEVPQLYTEGRASSYHFIHLTLQEYLAAIHISQLPAHKQTRLVRKHLDSGHFKMTIRFLAGLTKLANVPTDITRWLMKSDDTKLSYFHILFEAKDISVTTTTLSSNEMIIGSHYSWTPLDYYVTGHAISHSNCSWRLLYSNSSIDDEKFELFCQGCAAPGGTGCRGHISYANFSNNGVTYKSIQSFVNIPTHILQDMRVLILYHNKLDRSACDLLAKAVQSMSRLEELWLGLNLMESGGAVEVIKALCGSEVKVLWLNNTGIGVPDCEALCDLLRSSHSLKCLDIENNNLSSASVASIITGLSHNSSLTKLDISNSKFSMMNVDSLASLLKNESKCMLTQLLLQGCHISGQGACELAAAFCKNSTLKILELDHNPIGVEGAYSMSDVLQYNTSLEWLHLCDDSIREEGVHQLINSLKHN